MNTKDLEEILDCYECIRNRLKNGDYNQGFICNLFLSREESRIRKEHLRACHLYLQALSTELGGNRREMDPIISCWPVCYQDTPWYDPIQFRLEMLDWLEGWFLAWGEL